MIVIRGGQVLTDAGLTVADVAISDGVVQSIGPDLKVDGAVVDASGCWVGPGLVDLHVHLREPGQEWKEDITSGSRSAAAGGFTAVVAMPNTLPPVDAGHRASFIAERGREAGLCEVMAAGALTLSREGNELSRFDELLDAGVRVFTDDGDTVVDAGLLRRAMEYLGERGAVVAQHAEDPGLAQGGHMHEGAVSSRLGIRGLPALAEETVVARDLALVELTRARYHVQHVSTSGTVELVRRAKQAGLPVTAEVTPHHLMLDHTEVESMDPDYKMYPPLRTETDVAELRKALIDGTIDAVATDHAPHADHEQEVPFEEAPRGVVGLETAASVVITATGTEPTTFFERMSITPAHIAGLDHQGLPLAEGRTANVTVVDPRAEWTPDRFVSRSQNSPFLGRKLTGRTRLTIYRGTITYREEP